MTDSRTDIRAAARQRRAALTDRGSRSREIIRQVARVPGFATAQTVLCYVSVRTEVETDELIHQLLPRTLAVPWCDGEVLRLARIRSFDELQPATFGIREPIEAVRRDPQREVPAEDLDWACLPGLAFDESGGRLGYGRGYFDRLLAACSPRTQLTALAFDCQVFEAVPQREHDVRMHRIVTETRICECV